MKLLDSNVMILIMSDTNSNKSDKDESGSKEGYLYRMQSIDRDMKTN